MMAKVRMTKFNIESVYVVKSMSDWQLGSEWDRKEKKVSRETASESELIHRDYKHYFGISLGIIFSRWYRSEREGSIDRENTSGQFSIYWKINTRVTIETAVRSLYLIIGYGKKYQCRRQRLINLNRYCWRQLIKKIVFLYFNRFSCHFLPTTNTSLFVLLDIYLVRGSLLFVINYLITCVVCVVNVNAWTIISAMWNRNR